jgi:hypothetical protein
MACKKKPNSSKAAKLIAVYMQEVIRLNHEYNNENWKKWTADFKNLKLYPENKFVTKNLKTDLWMFLQGNETKFERLMEIRKLRNVWEYIIKMNVSEEFVRI